MEKLKQYLRKYSWYRWCEANDLLSHYYILQYIFIISSLISLYKLMNNGLSIFYNGFVAYIIGFGISIVVALLKEFIDTSTTGFNVEDIKNGFKGVGVGTIKYWIILLIISFIINVWQV